jgi:hypothetical protein
MQPVAAITGAVFFWGTVGWTLTCPANIVATTMLSREPDMTYLLVFFVVARAMAVRHELPVA